MQERYGQVDDIEARRARAETVIRIAANEEEPLVHEPDFAHAGAPYDHRPAGDPPFAGAGVQIAFRDEAGFVHSRGITLLRSTVINKIGILHVAQLYADDARFRMFGEFALDVAHGRLNIQDLHIVAHYPHGPAPALQARPHPVIDSAGKTDILDVIVAHQNLTVRERQEIELMREGVVAR